jgi:hypothetical protein
LGDEKTLSFDRARSLILVLSKENIELRYESVLMVD